MNIGIFGGTFDPPHVGHLIVCEHAREELGLDKILFIPSAISPHKQHHQLVNPEARLEMVRLATFGQDFFEPCDVEVHRGGVSYTVDTLDQLRQTYPNEKFTLLLGFDNLVEFGTWKSPERILQLATVAAMTRPGVDPDGVADDLCGKFTLCRVPGIGISSSEIRDRVKHGKSIHYLVPKPVESYIYYRKLYV